MLAMLALLAGGLVVASPALVRRAVLSAAASRGVVLDDVTVAFDLRGVTLTDVRARLAQAPGVRIRAARVRVDVALPVLAPVRSRVEGVEVEAEGWGAALSLLERLDGPLLREAPVQIVGAARVVLRRLGDPGADKAPPGASPIDGAGRVSFDVAVDASGVELAPGHATLAGVDATVVGLPAPVHLAAAAADLGPRRAALAAAKLSISGVTVPARDVTAELDGSNAHVVIRDGARELAADIAFDAARGAARVDLAPRPVADLAALAGIAVTETFVVGGTVELVSRPPSATVQVSLEGFVPPHPRELDGIVFGKTTTVRATATLGVDPDVVLRDVELKAGALALRGDGDVRVATRTLRLDLRGSLACSELAASAAGARLGVLGPLAGALARTALGGTIAVRVGVEIGADDLAHPRVVPSVAGRCRLGPLQTSFSK